MVDFRFIGMFICSVYGQVFSPKFPGHDPGVCLIEVKDGSKCKIVAHEEMKLTSEKTWAMQAFPDRSFFSALKDFNIKPKDINTWVFPSDGEDNFNESWKTLSRFLKLEGNDGFDTEEYFLEAKRKKRIRMIKHHDSHAALAIYTSQKHEGLVLTMDGGGDIGDAREGALYSFKGGNIVCIDELRRGSRTGVYGSLARYHNLITECLGFGQDENGKVSGMAGYGSRINDIEVKLKSRFEWDGIWPLFRATRKSRTDYKIDRYSSNSYEWRKVAEAAPGEVDLFEELCNFDPFDVAKSAESVLLEIALEMRERICKRHGEYPVAYAGGLFNNVSVNLGLAIKDEVMPHFSMAPGDSGLATGAALMVANEVASTRQRDPFIGRRTENSEIIELIEQYRLKVHEYTNKNLIESLQEGKIIGVFRGRAELGPRSLGNRSILGDPTNKGLKVRVNAFLKRRDWFMPFAPAIIEEKLSLYTDYSNYCSEYMQTAVPMNAMAAKVMPCAVHVDGTSRVQKVCRELNPWFYDLIQEFGDKSGVYAVLNTSFNRHGISTISSPRQAIEHLMAGCIDELVVGSYLIKGSENRLYESTLMEIEDESVSMRKTRRLFTEIHGTIGVNSNDHE